MDFDLIISGAGPAGLCLARALSGQGLRIALVEQQPLAALEQPAFDGREIALTQHSAQCLRRLGLWQRIDPQALSPLRDARVLDGASPFAMVIGHGLTRQSELGWLVANHLIRRAACEAARVTLASGCTLRARLLVAADSRFSATRRAMGIAAEQHVWPQHAGVLHAPRCAPPPCRLGVVRPWPDPGPAAHERRSHQRRATRPLYLATQLITRLYTHEAAPARLLRGLALRLGEHCTPFKRAVANALAGAR